MGDSASPVSYKQQLRFAISGLATRDLEQPSVAAARVTLRSLRNNDKQLRAALLDILAGIDAAPKHAAKCRLQLAEYAVLECLTHQLLIQVLPKLSQQASLVLAAHRQDAGCINSLAALLTSCVAKLLLEPSGSYAAIHGKASGAGAAQLVTADLLCEALLFPVITSTYRDPEQTRVSAGSVVLLGLFELLKGHTDQAAVIEAIRRCTGLMLQLLAAGTVVQRAPGVLLPVCSCVEVLGLSMDKEGTRRLLKVALKAASSRFAWQVRRDACQALAVLAASLQFRTLPPIDSPQPAPGQPELVLTPAVEVLVATKPSVMQVLDDVRYDKIAAVRTAAAAAAAEFATLPNPPAAEDDTWSGADTAGGGSSRRPSSGKPGRARDRKKASRSGPQPARKKTPPARFVRPKMQPGTERDFGVLVFAPPHPPPPPEPPAEAADASQAHGADQSPVARRLFDAETSVRASVDAASQTCAEGPAEQQQPYTVQSPLSGSSQPFFATSGSPSPGLSSQQHAELQQQLQHQLHQQLQQQQSGLPALLAATGLGGSPMRLDISHHVHGRVELGFGHSPINSQAGSPGPQPVSPASTPAGAAGSPAPGVAASFMAAMAAAGCADAGGSPGAQHSVHTVHPLWGVQQQEQQQPQGWASMSAGDVGFEPSFCPQGTALRDSLEGPASSAAADAGSCDATGEAVGQAGGEWQHAAAANQQGQPAAAAGSVSSASTSQQGHRQRQRWQGLTLATGSAAASGPPSRQCTPAGEADPPRSPTSLEVLRSVGERVQHLLETLSLSRQASGSSRHGSRSPVALSLHLGRAADQSQPPSPTALPLPRGTRSSSSTSSGGVGAGAAEPAPGGTAAGAAAVQLPDRLQVQIGSADGGWQQQSQQRPRAAAASPSGQSDAAGHLAGLGATCSTVQQEQDRLQTAALQQLDPTPEQERQQQQHPISQQASPSRMSEPRSVQQEIPWPQLSCGGPRSPLEAPSQSKSTAGRQVGAGVQLLEQQQLQLQEQYVELLGPAAEAAQEEQQQQQLLLALELQQVDAAELPPGGGMVRGSTTELTSSTLLQPQHGPQQHSPDAPQDLAVQQHAHVQPGLHKDLNDSSSSMQGVSLPGQQAHSTTPPATTAAAAEIPAAAADGQAAGGAGCSTELPAAAPGAKQHQHMGQLSLQQTANSTWDAPDCLAALHVQSAGSLPVSPTTAAGEAECAAASLSQEHVPPAAPQEQWRPEETEQGMVQEHGAANKGHLPAQAGSSAAVPACCPGSPDTCSPSPQGGLTSPGPCKLLQQQQQEEEQEGLQPEQLQEHYPEEVLLHVSNAAPEPQQEGTAPHTADQQPQLLSTAPQHAYHPEEFLLSQQEHHDSSQPSQQGGEQETGSGEGDQPWQTRAPDSEQGSAFSMQYNQLFQPYDAGLQGTQGPQGTDRLSSTTGATGLQAGVSASGLALAAASRSSSEATQAAAGGPDEPSSLSRLDKALQKLESLRSTLQSLPPSAQDSGLLHSGGSGLQLSTQGPSRSSSSHLQLLSSAGAQVPPAAASSALASAKDWIREISQRLQVVAAPAEGLSTAASIDAQALTAPPPPGTAFSNGNEAALSSVLQDVASDCPAWQSQGGGAALPGVVEQAPGGACSAAAAAQPAGAALDAASGLLAVSSAPEVPSQAAADGEAPAACGGAVPAAASGNQGLVLQPPAGSSPGWSTLTAGSSSSEAGSEQLGGLAREQLQSTVGSAQHTQGYSAGAAAGEVAAADSAQSADAAQETAAQPCGSRGTGTLQQGQLFQARPPEATAPAELQQQQVQVQAEAEPAAVASLSGAGRAAGALVQSGQRLQQLLAQSDDTMLLMSFALKLDRLGRKFRLPDKGAHDPHGGALGTSLASPLRLSPGSPGLWQTPGRQSASHGSPGRAVSPAGPWTNVTHNTLYNASPASTPPRPSASAAPGGALEDLAGAQAVGSSALGAAAGSSTADGGHAAPLSQWGSLSVVADPWQADHQQQQQEEEEPADAALTAQLQDAVLCSVLGVGLEQLLDGGEQAMDAIATVLSALQQQLQVAGMPQAAAAEQAAVEPLVMLLQEDLRRELRQQTCQALCCRGGLGGADVEATLLHQEHLFVLQCWPLIVSLVQQVVEGVQAANCIS